MNHDEFEELCALSTLDLLDGSERRRFEQHLHSPCATCEAELRAFTETAAWLPHALPKTGPSPVLKARLLKSLQERPPLGTSGTQSLPVPYWARPGMSRPSTPRWVPLTMGIAACLILILGAVTFSMNDRMTQQRVTIEQLNAQVADLADRTAALAALLRTMTDPDVRSIRLTGLSPEPRASGKAFIDVRARTVLFYAYGLTAAPSGMTYQLWAIPKGKQPISAGVFVADSTGNASLTIRALVDVETLETLAVTLEPAGGLPQPTGPMYLAGS